MASTPGLHFLSFSSFHTDPSYFKNGRGGLIRKGLLEGLPERVPGVRRCFPAQSDVQQVSNLLLREHQEGVGQVQTHTIRAGQRNRTGKVRPAEQLRTAENQNNDGRNGLGEEPRHSHVNIEFFCVGVGPEQLDVECGVSVVRMVPVENVHLHLVVVTLRAKKLY